MTSRPTGRRRFTAAWLLASLLVLAACSGGDAATSGATSAATAAGVATEDPGVEPVVDQDFPDPDVLRVGDTYFAYATQPAGQGRNVQVARSPDLVEWEVLSEDPLPELPDWATTGRTWAPEVADLGGDGYVMYFTARSVDPDLQCIGVATAGDPLGPFEPASDEPLVCPEDRGGAIDAASFVDDDGKAYLLWKNDGNCCAKDTWLHLQPLSADGLKLTGPPERLIKQTKGWEGDLVEAPTLVKRDETYVLLYSANSYAGDQYATGYATADAVDGPYEKAPEPLLSTVGTDGAYIGPGGQDVVEGADGQDLLLFHAWAGAMFYRAMHAVELEWEDGRPVIGEPVTAQP